MRTLWNFSNYGNDLRLTSRDVETCSHSGDCENDVLEVMQKPYIKNQLSSIDKEALKRELSEYGAWNETELNSHEQNLVRWVWLSACDIKDNKMTK